MYLKPIDLLKEAKSTRDDNAISQALVDKANLILSEESTYAVINNVFPNSQGNQKDLAYAIKSKYKTQERLKANDLLYTEQELIVLCNKYNLKLMRTLNYKCSVPKECGSAITEFKKTDQYRDMRYSEFYILAPGSHFVKPPKTTHDPIVFCKNRDTDEYTFVYKWGNDFTITRRLSGLFHEYGQTIVFLLFLMSLACVWFGFDLMFLKKQETYLFFTGVVGTITSIILMFNPNIKSKHSYLRNWYTNE